MDIVFCKTRADPEFYRSYTDFWRLVELSGFEVVWLDELEPGWDAVYVVTPRNGELPGVLPRLQGERRCKFVWWCLERPDAQGSVTRGKALENGIDELWLSDEWLARRHAVNGWGPVRFVPFGSHEGLGPELLAADQFDWAHLSYATPRRQAIYRHIQGTMLPNSWGAVRHDGLRATRLMVNVHQDGAPYYEPLRFALAAAYGLPIVSELSMNTEPYVAHEAPYERMVYRVNEAIAELRKRPMGRLAVRLAKQALANWQVNCRESTFGACVEEAVGCLR